MRVQFIDADYVKNNNIIEYNVDDSNITRMILKAQDVYLLDILGDTFKNHLESSVIANTLNSDELNLIKTYIQPMVNEYTFWLLMPYFKTKITNKSVANKTSEFSDSADLSELKYLRNDILNMAEHYRTQLSKYLCKNSALFPQFINNSNDINQPQKRSFFSGIYVKRSNTNYDGYDKPI